MAMIGGNTTHKEKLVSGLGGALSIFLVFWVTGFVADAANMRVLLMASMGATAVLIFAAPHGPLSQPWNVIGGHTVSAAIGISVHKLGIDPVIAGAIAVGLAITAIYYLQCLHPPGGATALIPILSGSAIDDYGYWFVLFPAGLGALLMVLAAIAYNYPFPWRRYPLSVQRMVAVKSETKPLGPAYPDITHADLVAALSEIDTFIDVSEEDLLRIYELACRRRHPALSGELV